MSRVAPKPAAERDPGSGAERDPGSAAERDPGPGPRAARPRLEPPFPILCFGYHPWSPSWKRNQSLMAALARRPAIAEVVFVNPPVSLAHSPGRLLRELGGPERYRWRGVLPFRPMPRLEVRTPIHLVPFRRRLAALGRLDRALVRAALDRFGGRPFLLLVNGVRVETQELIDLVAGEAAFHVFDWSDDFAQFPRDPAARELIDSLTVRSVRRADLVLAVNQNLAARAQALGARVEVVLNATGLAPAGGGEPRRPGARALGARLRRPVVGYAGYINEHRVDLELVVELARRHPEWTFLFLGLVQLDFDRRFPPLPNLAFHPLVPHRELADYLALFDVCLIPHLDNAHTAGNNPLKLYDYLTTGRPVVSTRVAGVEGFEDVVEVAADRASFIAAVEAAAAAAVEGSEPPERAAARRARAAAHTWEARAAEVEALLLGALAEPGPPRPPTGPRAGSR